MKWVDRSNQNLSVLVHLEANRNVHDCLCVHGASAFNGLTVTQVAAILAAAAERDVREAKDQELQQASQFPTLTLPRGLCREAERTRSRSFNCPRGARST